MRSPRPRRHRREREGRCGSSVTARPARDARWHDVDGRLVAPGSARPTSAGGRQLPSSSARADGRRCACGPRRRRAALAWRPRRRRAIPPPRPRRSEPGRRGPVGRLAAEWAGSAPSSRARPGAAPSGPQSAASSALATGRRSAHRAEPPAARAASAVDTAVRRSASSPTVRAGLPAVRRGIAAQVPVSGSRSSSRRSRWRRLVAARIVTKAARRIEPGWSRTT